MGVYAYVYAYVYAAFLRNYKVKAKVTKCQYPVEVVRIEHKNNYFFKFYQVC